MSSGDRVIEAIRKLVATGGEADDVLRGVVEILHAEGGCDAVAIDFAEGDGWVRGPAIGSPSRLFVPVIWDGYQVAVIAADSRRIAVLERAAELIAAHCLVGWDTGGEDWEP